MGKVSGGPCYCGDQVVTWSGVGKCGQLNLITSQSPECKAQSTNQIDRPSAGCRGSAIIEDGGLSADVVI